GVDGESHFTMLEMLRDYSLERLQASGEEEGIRGLHAEYYLALAQAADVKLRGAEQLIWLDRLEQEHDNLRAVLHRSIGEVEGVSFEDRGNVEVGLRLANALSWFWHRRGYYNEGRNWLERGLARAG